VGTNNKKAVGNREEAIRLLKETEIPANQICKMTGVPKGSIGRLAQMYRSQEVTDRVKKKARQESLDKRKVKWVEKPEDKPSIPMAGPPPGFSPKELAAVQPVTKVGDYDVSVHTFRDGTNGVVMCTDKESPTPKSTTNVEYNFNFNVSGKQVSVDEVITKLDELKTILKLIPVDAVNFRVNVGS